MTFFLRDQYNNTIIETEVYSEEWSNGERYIEVSSSVDIREYSNFLINNLDNIYKKIRIIAWIANLDELRGWLWESYFINKKNIYNEKEIAEVQKHISNFYKEAAKQLDLHFVVD